MGTHHLADIHHPSKGAVALRRAERVSGGGGAGQCFWEREACSGVQEEEKRGSRCPLRGEGRVVARTAGAVPGVGARVGAGGRFCGWLVWCWYFVTRLRGNKKRCTPS